MLQPSVYSEKFPTSTFFLVHCCAEKNRIINSRNLSPQRNGIVVYCSAVSLQGVTGSARLIQNQFKRINIAHSKECMAYPASLEAMAISTFLSVKAGVSLPEDALKKRLHRDSTGVTGVG